MAPRLPKTAENKWVFPKIGGKTPNWMVKIRENPIRIDDLGGKPTIFGNTQMDNWGLGNPRLFSCLARRWCSGTALFKGGTTPNRWSKENPEKKNCGKLMFKFDEGWFYQMAGEETTTLFPPLIQVHSQTCAVFYVLWASQKTWRTNNDNMITHKKTGLPSRELTYPQKMAFWRWFSFSPGGRC